jgi:hypothetical protein
MKGSTSPAVINGLRRISPITVETIKEFSQVMKSQTFKECSQRSAFNMSSRLCIAGFIFETGSRPENFIFHHSFPQRSQHLDWAFTGQPNACIADPSKREITFMEHWTAPRVPAIGLHAKGIIISRNNETSPPTNPQSASLILAKNSTSFSHTAQKDAARMLHRQRPGLQFILWIICPLNPLRNDVPGRPKLAAFVGATESELQFFWEIFQYEL